MPSSGNSTWVDNVTAITAARVNAIESALTGSAPKRYLDVVADYGVNSGMTAAARTTALNTAIADAIAAKTPLRIPAGTYNISGALNAQGDNLWILGDGMYSSRIVQTTANTPILKVGGQFQRFDGLGLEYSSQQAAANTSANCVEHYTSYFSHFSNIYTYGGARHWWIPQVDPGPGQNGAFSNLYQNIRGLGATLAWINLTGYVGYYTGSVWNNAYFNNKVGGSIIACAGPVVQFSNADEVVLNQLNIEDVDMSLSGSSDKIILLGNRATTINGLHFERVKMGAYQATLVVASSLCKLRLNSCSVVYCEVTGSSNSNRSLFKLYQGRMEASGVNVHNCLKESGCSVYLVDVLDNSQRAKAVLAMADYDAAASSTSTMGTTGVTWATGSFFTGNAVNDTTSVVSVS